MNALHNEASHSGPAMQEIIAILPTNIGWASVKCPSDVGLRYNVHKIIILTVIIS
jgi:hypothetical protein